MSKKNKARNKREHKQALASSRKPAKLPEQRELWIQWGLKLLNMRNVNSIEVIHNQLVLFTRDGSETLDILSHPKIAALIEEHPEDEGLKQAAQYALGFIQSALVGTGSGIVDLAGEVNKLSYASPEERQAAATEEAPDVIPKDKVAELVQPTDEVPHDVDEDFTPDGGYAA